METTKKVRMISKRTVLVSVIVLLTATLKASTIQEGLNLTDGSMFFFYLTGAMFFSLFLLHLAGSRLTKNNNALQHDAKVIPLKRRHQHYRKVVKKTA